MTEDPETPESGEVDVPWRVPVDNVQAYVRLYQLEQSLREVIYLELKAAFGAAWETEFERRVATKHKRAQSSRGRDKSLTHMRTREEGILAYSDIGDLFHVLFSPGGGTVDRMFAPFMPPAPILKGRIAEIIPIRLRTMHCRTLHTDDLARLMQFLRDIDQGLWRWCTSYNGPRIAYSDALSEPIGRHFREFIPRVVGWDQDGCTPPVSIDISYSLRPGWRGGHWTSGPVAGPGWLYHFQFYGNPHSERSVDEQAFLRSVRALLDYCVFVHVGDVIELSMPAVGGADEVMPYAQAFVEAAQAAAFRRRPGESTSQQYYEALVKTYPEHVLTPMDTVSFLSDDMPCSWFGLDVPVPPRGRI